MKRTENQAFCMSSSPRTLDRVPDGRPRLSRKREGTQGRTVHFLLIPTESQPSKPFRVPDIERTPGAAQLEARDRGGASPPSPGDPQGTSSRARCRASHLPGGVPQPQPPRAVHTPSCREPGQPRAYTDPVGGPSRHPAQAFRTANQSSPPPGSARCLHPSRPAAEPWRSRPRRACAFWQPKRLSPAQPSPARSPARASSSSKAGGYPAYLALSRAS